MEVPASTLNRWSSAPNGAAHDSPGQRPAVSRSPTTFPSPERATQPIPLPDIQALSLSRLHAVGCRRMTRAETRRRRGSGSSSSSHHKVIPFAVAQVSDFLSLSASLRLCAIYLLHGYGYAALSGLVFISGPCSRGDAPGCRRTPRWCWMGARPSQADEGRCEPMSVGAAVGLTTKRTDSTNVPSWNGGLHPAPALSSQVRGDPDPRPIVFV
jgi:hypothetical protein